MATVIAKVKTPSRHPQASQPKPVVDGEYLLTADEFDRIDSLLDRHAELIDGRIMERPDVDPPHALVGNLLNIILSGLLHDQSLSNRYYVSIGMPLRISEYTEPLPDVMIIRGTPRSYASKHPGPTDMALVIEVSFSTLSKDRGKKLRLYAQAGVETYWIIDIKNRRIEAYTDPISKPDRTQSSYRNKRVFKSGDKIEIKLGAKPIGKIAVSEILP
jgi:Uma2 family endonuclease